MTVALSNPSRSDKRSSSAEALAELRPPTDLPAPSVLATRKLTPNVCRTIHDLVFEFREAHGVTSASSPNREAAIRKYPLSKAPPNEAPAIEKLSSENSYAEFRQGGRLTAAYPPLPEAVLRDVCREIRAALVWCSRLRAA